MCLNVCVKAHSSLADPGINDLIEAVKSASNDKQDVCRVDLNELLLGMLASSLWRDRCVCPLDDLQKCLLHTFAGDISCDGDVLTFLRYFIDFIDINDTELSSLDVVVSGLDQLKKDILNVLAYITRFCESRRIGDRERDIDNLGQCLGKIGLSRSGRSQHQDIALLELYAVILAKTGLVLDSLIMIVNGNRKRLLGLILPDHVVIEECLYLRRF